MAIRSGTKPITKAEPEGPTAEFFTQRKRAEAVSSSSRSIDRQRHPNPHRRRSLFGPRYDDLQVIRGMSA
jgi:hypothetical protein